MHLDARVCALDHFTFFGFLLQPRPFAHPVNRSLTSINELKKKQQKNNKKNMKTYWKKLHQGFAEIVTFNRLQFTHT